MSYEAIAKRAKVTPDTVRAVLTSILIQARNRPYVRLRNFGTFKIRRSAPRLTRKSRRDTPTLTRGKVTLLFECSDHLMKFLAGTMTDAESDPVLEVAAEFHRRDVRDGKIPKRKKL